MICHLCFALLCCACSDMHERIRTLNRKILASYESIRVKLALTNLRSTVVGNTSVNLRLPLSFAWAGHKDICRNDCEQVCAQYGSLQIDSISIPKIFIHAIVSLPRCEAWTRFCVRPSSSLRALFLRGSGLWIVEGFVWGGEPMTRVSQQERVSHKAEMCFQDYKFVTTCGRHFLLCLALND